MFVLPDAPVTLDTREMALSLYPTARKKGHGRMLAFLLSGYKDRWIYEQTGEYLVPAPYQVIQAIYDAGPRTSAESLIQAFSEEVTPVEYDDHDHARHLCRRIRVPKSLLDLQTNDLNSGQPLVSWVTGHPWGSNQVDYAQKKTRLAAKAMLRGCQMEAIAAYLHSREVWLFKIKPESMMAAYHAIAALGPGRKQAHAAYQLCKLEREPGLVPTYFPVPGSARIFSGSPIHQLPGSVRRTLFPGYVELDLECVQLACMATFLGAKQVVDYLHDVGSPWADIAAATGTTPKAVKRVAYPFAFGAGRKRILAEADATPADVRAILEHFVFKELLDRRDRCLDDIKREGFGVDPVTGRQIPLPRTKHPELSVFAAMMQSMEGALIRPAFQAMSWLRPDTKADISSFFHDSFMLMVKQPSKRDNTVNILKRAVAQTAETMGVPTGLVQKL